MNNNLIDNVTTDFTDMVQERIGKDIIQCRLFGSCARGDYDCLLYTSPSPRDTR